MRKLFVWLLTISLVDSNSLKFTSISCSNSDKRSAELTNCRVNGRYLSFNLNFLRRLDSWKVRKFSLLIIKRFRK